MSTPGRSVRHEGAHFVSPVLIPQRAARRVVQ
jgi:hypothetical protein